MVEVLEVSGRCGSTFFHIQRGDAHFREFAAAARLAFAGGHKLWLHTVACAADRHLTSHGMIERQPGFSGL